MAVVLVAIYLIPPTHLAIIRSDISLADDREHGIGKTFGDALRLKRLARDRLPELDSVLYCCVGKFLHRTRIGQAILDSSLLGEVPARPHSCATSAQSTHLSLRDLAAFPLIYLDHSV